jgi:hypothetical protein
MGWARCTPPKCGQRWLVYIEHWLYPPLDLGMRTEGPNPQSNLRQANVGCRPPFRHHVCIILNYAKRSYLIFVLISNEQVILTSSQVEALSVIEKSKRLAAFAAVDEHLQKEHKVRKLSCSAIMMWMYESTGNWYWIWYGQINRCCNLIGWTLRLGSTVPYVVERIFGQGLELNKDRVFIPTGLYLFYCFTSVYPI